MIERLDHIIFVARRKRLEAEYQYEVKKTTRPLYFALKRIADARLSPDKTIDHSVSHERVYSDSQRILSHIPSSITGLHTPIGIIVRAHHQESEHTSEDIYWTLLDVEAYARNMATHAGIEWEPIFTEDE